MVSVQKMQKRRTLAVNDKGYRLGEDHHRAKLTNHEVDLVLELLDGGMSERLVAEKMEISRRTVRDYKAAKTRAQTPHRFVATHPPLAPTLVARAAESSTAPRCENPAHSGDFLGASRKIGAHWTCERCIARAQLKRQRAPKKRAFEVAFVEWLAGADKPYSKS